MPGGPPPPEWPEDGKVYKRAYIYSEVYKGPDRDSEVQFDEFFLKQRGWQRSPTTHQWVLFLPLLLISSRTIC